MLICSASPAKKKKKLAKTKKLKSTFHVIQFLGILGFFAVCMKVDVNQREFVSRVEYSICLKVYITE